MAGKIKRLLALGAVVLTTAALAWAGSDDQPKASGAPKPVITKAVKGEQCVEPNDFMRRNHMKVLLHHRDETVLEGIRTKKYSLKECINCHASEKLAALLRPRTTLRELPQLCGCENRLFRLPLHQAAGLDGDAPVER
ncbi:hypothetical protein [Thiobacillus sp.]|uniref:hypothetical protein n=1 Tax=Thiobacillus sp. TaxID=924 RepID=UPI0025F97DBA|nr:hypothetical protein [Thiobacillus sp.]